MRIASVLFALALVVSFAEDASAQGRHMSRSRTRTIVRTDTVKEQMSAKAADSVAGIDVICGVVKNGEKIRTSDLPRLRLEMASGTSYDLLGDTDFEIVAGNRYLVRYSRTNWSERGIVISAKPVTDCSTRK